MTEYSPELRSALSETLALVANQHADFKHISGKARWTPASAVRSLVYRASAERWIRLSPQLPTLAEAAPDVFLDSVDDLLLDDEKVLAIYAQEGKGVFGGGNPMTGILWALEVLAWSPEYLPRATLALGGFDKLDPGGTWGNRALSSLTHIYLPWLPQTLADTSKRMSALLALSKEYSATAWSLYLSLLPGATQSSSGTQKPRWLINVPEDNVPVSRLEYWEQIQCYANRAVDLAEESEARLLVLSSKLETLPDDAFKRAIATLKARTVSKATRYDIWRELVRLAGHHKRASSADWSMGDDRIAAVEETAIYFQPTAPAERYRPLFATDNYDLFDDDEWTIAQSKLLEAQKVAAYEVWNDGGPSGMALFSSQVDNRFALGWALGASGANPSGKVIRELAASPSSVDLVAGYLTQGETTGDRPLTKTDFTGWASDEIAGVLSRMRIDGSAAWQVAERLLGAKKMLFWRLVDVPLIEDPEDLHHAVGEFLSVGRPLAAVRAIHSHAYRFGSINVADTCAALTAAAGTGETPSAIDGHAVINLIERLQKSESIAESELSTIEWKYLELLQRPGGAFPKTLEWKLSRDPKFFCEVVRAVFRSKDAPEPTNEPTKAERQKASNAYRLLMNWKTPPGTINDDTFSGARFASWLNEVVVECTNTGHLEVALHQLGPVLVHVPADPTGFWIDSTVAEELNRRDMEELRSGYRTGIFNSRGARWVDPTGNPEIELATKFLKRAEDADSRGFARLAFAMRQLSKEYAHDATRIRSEHSESSE